MSVLVMDGVRRPGRLGAAASPAEIVSAPSAAATMTYPASALGLTFDGIRRFVPAAAPLPEPAEIVAPIQAAAPALPVRRLSPMVITSVILAPLVAASSVNIASNLLPHSASSRVVTWLPVQTPAIVTPKPLAQTASAPAPAPVVSAPAAEAVQAGDIDFHLPLQQILDQFDASTNSTYGLVVKNLTTGEMALASPDHSFRSASFYKLFVANAILRRIDAGSLSLNSGAGEGTGENINQCLNSMITISDNACGEALGDLVGFGAITNENRDQGYTATNLNQPMMTTPRDVATLFERLYAGQLLSPASNQLFLNLLKAQKVNNRLPQGLPAGTAIAHKTGDLFGFMHDGGIVYSPKATYLVVMMGAPGASPDRFASLSRVLYNHFNQ